MLHFYASWAPQCQQVDDVLTELHRDSSLAAVVKFLKVLFLHTACWHFFAMLLYCMLSSSGGIEFFWPSFLLLLTYICGFVVDGSIIIIIINEERIRVTLSHRDVAEALYII